MDQFHLIAPERPKSKSKGGMIIFAISLCIGLTCLVLLMKSTEPRHLGIAQYKIEEQEFQEYIEKYNKKYIDDAEYQYRFQIFRDNLAFARVHNQLGRTWTLGVNQFTDYSMEEFRKIFLPYEYPMIETSDYIVEDNTDYPTSLDWRQKGAVVGIKYQGNCGSCWSFSTAASVESAWFIYGNPLVSLSEQALVDCSTSYGTYGCQGGNYYAGFKYTMRYGLPLQTTYPYKAVQQTCNTTLQMKTAAKISNFVYVQSGSSSAMLNAVASRPISVAVQADQPVWQLYTGGVVTSNCGTNLNHAVNIVGYNTTTNPPFWIVRNSWGTWWGEKGYIRIGISDGNGVCGINIQPAYPVV